VPVVSAAKVDCDGLRAIAFAGKESSDLGGPHDHSVAEALASGATRLTSMRATLTRDAADEASQSNCGSLALGSRGA
jgi:hypothetical protein